MGSDRIYILDRNNRRLSGFNAYIYNLKKFDPSKGVPMKPKQNAN